MAICSICEALGLILIGVWLASVSKGGSVGRIYALPLAVSQVLPTPQAAITCPQDRWSKMAQGLACCDVGIEGKCDSGQHSPTLSLDSKNKNIHGNENFADMLSSSNHTDHVNTLSQRSCGCNANKRRSHNRMKNRMPGKIIGFVPSSDLSRSDPPSLCADIYTPICKCTS